jgi:hypothetical protein
MHVIFNINFLIILNYYIYIYIYKRRGKRKKKKGLVVSNWTSPRNQLFGCQAILLENNDH